MRLEILVSSSKHITDDIIKRKYDSYTLNKIWSSQFRLVQMWTTPTHSINHYMLTSNALEWYYTYGWLHIV